MRFHRAVKVATFFVLSIGAGSLPFTAVTSYAQSSTSGDITGTVTDSTGAAIPGAKVTVRSLDTGVTQALTVNGAGNYRASLLKPGRYSVSVTASGFQTTTTEVAVQVGQVVAADLKLGLGSNTTVVDVTSEAPLLHTENADIATTFSAEAVQSIPNPGNDLTYVAQTSPGAVMNTSSPSNGTAFGYGNFSVFGLPATSNTFTLNGTYENDPFLNLSSSGATNLLLGNNEVFEVNVVSNAYGAQYGGLGGAQVNEITQSGTNKFHGNAVYQWNGRVLNANDYFRNQTPDLTPRSFDNVNQFAASIGGPIIKDKLFFYVNYEGLRIVLPTSGTVFAPTQAYINQTIANAAVNDPAAVPMYKQLFSVYQNAKGYSTAAPSTTDPNAQSYTYSAGNFTHEFLLTSRVDAVLSSKDTAFGHFKWDKGTQATYTDPLNPIFNAVSIQPSFEGTLGETHVFTPNITNQFLFSVLWYSAVFTNQNLEAANALVPYTVLFDQLGGSFTGLGGIDYAWPQGRNVTNYQFIDDVSIIKGHHTFKTGVYFRRDDVTDYSPSVTTTPLVFADETVGGSFNSGLGFDYYNQQYPTRNTQPVAVYNLAAYAQDTWKLKPNFSLTAAVRFEHNSNPICGTNCFAYTNGGFDTLNPSTATAYNSLITSGQHAAFPSFQPIAVNPRIGFTFSPLGADTGTVVRGGFGLFTDVFPGTVADDFLNNAPTNVGFTLFGPGAGGTAAPTSVNPAEATSGEQITAASNRAFQAGFANGASNDTLSASVPGFAAPSISTANGKLFYPTYEEYSLEIEQALDHAHHTTLAIRYVGNHGYHEPVVNNGANAGAVNNGAQGATGIINFTGFPDAPPNPNFATATVVGNGAGSNYNGVSVGLVRQVKTLTLQANYSYSHALDEISNGGILGFGAGTSVLAPVNPYNLRQNYGNADYDVRHNFTAAYVYSMPYFGGPHLLTENWQVSGTVFHHTGFPFTVVDSAVQIENYGGTSVTMFAKQANAVKSCGGGAVFNNATGTTANPCGIAAAGNYVDPTGFGQQERNQTYGPSYTDSDFAIQKGFRLPIPHSDTGKIAVGAQFFNLFNHPNFANPGHDIANPATLGVITSTVNTPTSILGSGLGGDASPRLIQLKGTITF